MPIPRLTPSASPIDVTITVNKKLRPYFEIWFQRNRIDGETPEQFALRALKTAALNTHLQDTARAEEAAIEQEKTDKLEALQEDVGVLNAELD